MIAGEYGIMFFLNAEFDITGYTALQLVFTRPDGSTVTVTDPDVAPGSGDIVTPLGVFLDGQYATYTFQDGDVNQFGVYTAQLTYTDNSQKLISAPAYFHVDKP